MDALVIKNLTKEIGKKQILKDISFTVGAQEIVGFLGPNGSGKSTTIKCICGLYKLSGGEIYINGYDIYKNRKEALEQLGASIESPALYPQLTGREHLEMVGKWRKVKAARIKEMEEYTGLGQHLNKKTAGYSMGMKMRLMLALTLMSTPSLIILDEPTNGLDPQAVFELRREMETIREQGTAILFSSHQLGEVEKLADRIVFLNQGEKVYDGQLPEKMIKGTEYQISTNHTDMVLKILRDKNIADCKAITEKPGWLSFYAKDQNTFGKVFQALGEVDVQVFDMIKCETRLEDFYKAIYEEGRSDERTDTK